MPASTISDQQKGSSRRIPARLYSTSQPPSLSAFQKLCSEAASVENYPLAKAVESNIPIYDLSKFDPNDFAATVSLQDEWHHILLSGPGVLVLENMYSDTTLLARVNELFQKVIDLEKASASAKGDHFASNGKNDRMWNSFSKHGLQDPESFFEYYSNPWLALVCDAWLGPAYRITAQVNIVKPGGDAQVSHRDYHLGFQTAEACSQFPKAIQIASQFLTLQGAIAHSDMPDGSGSTRLLPFSQRFEEGYMAYRLPEFNDYFLSKYVSLPLKMGDGLFFNPALFHAAGNNQTADIVRKANLLQVSSAFGKTMETVDGLPLIERSWDILRRKYEKDGMTGEVKAFISAVMSGYPFPTNLDRRPPAPGGMAPESEQQEVFRALEEGWSKPQVMDALYQIAKGSQA